MESGTKKGVKECVGKQGCVGSGLGGMAGGREVETEGGPKAARQGNRSDLEGRN